MIFVLAAGVVKDPGSALLEPRFRKASRNMVLAELAMERALASVPGSWTGEDCGLVLGSCHGELEVTVGFLKTLADSGVARPILFQNSLHNSTTGFLAMNHSLTGPVITVSDLYYSGEEALETGLGLIRSGQCETCLVTSVDARAGELCSAMNGITGNNQYQEEGAATLLLGTKKACAQRQIQPLAEIVSLEWVSRVSQNARPFNAIEALIDVLPRQMQLELPGPNGGHTLIRWRC